MYNNSNTEHLAFVTLVFISCFVFLNTASKMFSFSFPEEALANLQTENLQTRRMRAPAEYEQVRTEVLCLSGCPLRLSKHESFDDLAIFPKPANETRKVHPNRHITTVTIRSDRFFAFPI